jgi:hypothetical protein
MKKLETYTPGEKPALLFDVDGVLLVTPERNPGMCPPGFQVEPRRNSPYTFWNPNHGEHMRELSRHADIMYLTSHGPRAHRNIGQYLGLPEFPWINYWAYQRAGNGERIVAAQEVCGNRPIAWIDDDHWANEFYWAQHREEEGIPTLLIKPDSEKGMQITDFQRINSWIGALAVGAK